MRSDELAAIESAIGRALATGDEGGLEVLGHGEISCVVAWRRDDAAFACKRLPLFDSAERFEAYRRVFDTYLETLAARGVAVVPSTLHTLDADRGRLAVYCVQPILDPAALLPDLLRTLDEGAAASLFDRVLDAILGAAGRGVGLDGQLSNWALVGDALRYLDVTTPMLRDEDGRERLDTGLFLASLPALLRPLVRWWFLSDILDKYYEPRGVVLDLLGNLYKERLEHLLPSFLERANARLERPLTEKETLAYYRDDARMWALLQRLRRLDRWWQRSVRRRTYPFLLPGSIER